MPRFCAPAPWSSVALRSASLRLVADHRMTVYAVVPAGQPAKVPADGDGVGVGAAAAPGVSVGAGVAAGDDAGGAVVGSGVGWVGRDGFAAGVAVAAGCWGTLSAASGRWANAVTRAIAARGGAAPQVTS